MPDLFKEIVPSILQTGKSVMQVEQDYNDYAPFLVNRALSYHIDCIHYANDMNLWPNIDKDIQYQYLLNSIRSMKRGFQPWQKAQKLEYLDCVKTYFGYSDSKAKDALKILSEDQLDSIRKITD